MVPVYMALAFAAFGLFTITNVQMFVLGSIVLSAVAAGVAYHEYRHPRA